MKRFFAFGCSFTDYIWPTWADILGREFEEYYNYGQCGGGNLFISSSVAEAVARHKINKSDTIMVMWSNYTREDRYLINSWYTPGNIFTKKDPYYTDKFIKNYVTIRGCYVRDMAQIFLTFNLLKSIGCNFKFMSIVDITNHNQYKNEDSSELVQDILNLYKEVIDEFKPSVHNVIFNYNYNSRPIMELSLFKRLDSHPLPLEHLEYISKVIPEYIISEETKNLVSLIDSKIRLEMKIINDKGLSLNPIKGKQPSLSINLNSLIDQNFKKNYCNRL